LGFIFSQIGKNGAIEFDVVLFQGANEAAVSQAVASGGGVNFDFLGAASGSFFLFSAPKSVRPSMEQRFFGRSLFGFSAPAITLGLF